MGPVWSAAPGGGRVTVGWFSASIRLAVPRRYQAGFVAV